MNVRAVLTAGIAALALSASVVATTAPARADDGGEIAAGVIGGLALGAIVGSAASNANRGYGYAPPPAYAQPAPVYGGGCYFTRQATYDPYGNFAGYRRVRVCE